MAGIDGGAEELPPRYILLSAVIPEEAGIHRLINGPAPDSRGRGMTLPRAETTLPFLDQCGGVGAEGFAATDGILTLSGLRFDADLLHTNSQSPRNLLSHFGNVRSQLRPLKADGGIEIHNLITSFLQKFADVAQESETRCIAPARGSIREVPPDIAQRCCAQKRVANRVREGVAVGVADWPFFKRNAHPAKHQLPT